MEFMRSLGLFLTGIARRWYVLLPGIAGGGLDIYERLADVQVDVPDAVSWSVLALSVFLASAWSYHDLRMQRSPSDGSPRRALRLINDELYYLFTRLNELDDGEYAAAAIGVGTFHVLPTEAWNQWHVELGDVMSQSEYEVVRDGFNEVDRFNRRMLAQTTPGPSLDSLRSKLEAARDVMPPPR